MIAFINDQFIDEREAFIGIGDLSVQRGFGLFDFFRTSNHVPLFLEDYLDRFFNSARQLRLEPQHSREELKKIIFRLTEANKIATAGIKMILTGGYSPDGYEPATPNLIITQHAIEISSRQHFQKGLNILLHEYLRDLPTAKSINYLMAIYLRDTLVAQNADDVLYHNNGLVLEFPRANLFIVTKDDTVVTPRNNVLAGITRKKVLEIAGSHFQAVERDVAVAELQDATEVFLTSTTKRILPVLTIDGRAIGDGKPGRITTSLYESFLQVEEAYCRVHAMVD